MISSRYCKSWSRASKIELQYIRIVFLAKNAINQDKETGRVRNPQITGQLLRISNSRGSSSFRKNSGCFSILHSKIDLDVFIRNTITTCSYRF
jgi:hypothetical protein